MGPTAEQLFQSALTLPDGERIALAEALLAVSAHPPAPELTGAAYWAEIRRRSADTDPAAWCNAVDALQRVHKHLGLTELEDD